MTNKNKLLKIEQYLAAATPSKLKISESKITNNKRLLFANGSR